MSNEETTPEKELKRFKKDFDKLMAKYPNVVVGCDIYGDLKAYQTDPKPFGKTYSISLS
jgi:hypothetical protein